MYHAEAAPVQPTAPSDRTSHRESGRRLL